MIRTIARRELLSNLMTFRFGAGMLLSVVLIALSAHVLVGEYEGKMSDYRLSVRKHADELKEVAGHYMRL